MAGPTKAYFTKPEHKKINSTLTKGSDDPFSKCIFKKNPAEFQVLPKDKRKKKKEAKLHARLHTD